MKLALRAGCAAALALSGCGAPASLVDHEAWIIADAPSDPFADRPAAVSCPFGSFGPDTFPEPVFTVRTDDCSYLTALQPSLVAIAPGGRVAVRIWRESLTSVTDTTAHVVVKLGEEVIAERLDVIPSDASDETVEWTASTSVARGTPIYFHLHNHGANLWALRDVVVR